MRDWKSMPKELVTKIAEHVELYEDFDTLQRICSCWRYAAKEAKFQASANKSSLNREHTLPLLMLPESNNSLKTRRLYGLSKHMFIHVNIPESLLNRGHDQIEKRLFSSYGWLLVAPDRKTSSLFNPFSGAIVNTPTIHLWYYRHQRIEYYHDKFVLSANPSTTSDFVVFLSLEGKIGRKIPPMLLFWRNGDKMWTPVLDPENINTGVSYKFDDFFFSLCHDITFYHGEFYAVNFYGTVVRFQTAIGYPYFHAVTKGIGDSRHDNEKWHYNLVESLGDLLIIRQKVWFYSKFKTINHWRCTKGFEVFKLNVMTGILTKVESLGNRAIFIGANSSFSVDVVSNSTGFKPNCIYFTDHRMTGRWLGVGQDCSDACVYNLTNGMLDKFYDGPSKSSHFSQHMWVESPNSCDFNL